MVAVELELGLELEFELGTASRMGIVMLLSSFEVLRASARWSGVNRWGACPPSDKERVFLAGVLSARWPLG